MKRIAQDLCHQVVVRTLRAPMHVNHLEWCPEYTEGSMPLAITIIIKGKGPQTPFEGLKLSSSNQEAAGGCIFWMVDRKQWDSSKQSGGNFAGNGRRCRKAASLHQASLAHVLLHMFPTHFRI